MFQNSQIRSKILAILLLPVACLGLLAAIQIGASLSAGRQAGRVHDATAFTAELTALIHELQRERALAAGATAGGGGAAFGDMITQRVRVNDALAAVRAARDRLSLADYGRFGDAVADADRALDELDRTRQQVDAAPRDGSGLATTLQAYERVIGSLQRVVAEVPGEIDDRGLARQLSTVAVLARAKEAAAAETALLYGALTAGKLEPAQAQQLAGLAGAFDALAGQFTTTATTAQQQLYDRAVPGPASDQVAELRTQALATPDDLAAIDPGVWLSAAEARGDALRSVEREVATDAQEATAAAGDAAQRRALLNSALVVVVALLSVGLALAWARSMGRTLRTLRSAAHEVAEERLPAVMEQLHRAELVERVDPGSTAGTLVPVGSRDEIGQVAEAFNAVHEVAMKAAADQAALRQTMGRMFVSLARRNQALIDRQLELIDELERGESNPDRLEDLFRLDHLATRMRRTAEDLVVLSGARPTRSWTEPVPLADVVRTALAEVEQYTRIDLLPLDDLALEGQAVEDVVHLLAELLENATTFSPPGSKVRVAGQAVSNGYVIEIEDRGIGMPDTVLAEVNRELDEPPNLEMADGQKLGLHVVARLANRYGIKVQLRHSWYGGITALVLLPEALLARTTPQATGPASLGRTGLALPAPASPGNGQAGPAGELPGAARRGDDRSWFDGGTARTYRLRRAPHPGTPGGGAADAPEPDGAAAASTFGQVPPRAPATPPPARPGFPTRLADLPQGNGQQAASAATGPGKGTREGDMNMSSDGARTNTLPRRVPGAGARRRGAPPINQPARPTKTASGLPRRVPRASLASGIPSTPAGRPEPVAALHRSPDDIRNLLSRYRTGFERGRHDAAGTDEWPAGPVPSTYARSDDDAVE